ncbi:MAG: tetratricopeptide repeat protein [Magnetococcales bacterium]|nr:tetratricopeptide repeat protein [Magnetococcales bacterium]
MIVVFNIFLKKLATTAHKLPTNYVNKAAWHLSVCVAVGLFFFKPTLLFSQTIGPTTIVEESLSGFASQDGGLVVAPQEAQNLLNKGAYHLALRLADQVLERGGAPLIPVGWVRVKAEALMALDRKAQALTLLESAPPHIYESNPTLWLSLGECYLDANNYAKARESYSQFMIRHGSHPQLFRAQLGMGLAGLAAGDISEAELLLNIYAQEGEKGRAEPLLIIALAKLAQLKGDKEAKNNYLAQLDAIQIADKELYSRTRVEVLALWYIQNSRWQKAFSLVEKGLQTNPSAKFRYFYQGLVQKWLLVYHAKKRGFDTSTLGAIRDLMRGGLPLKNREKALDLLLERELENPIGLFQESGLFTSGSFLAKPVDPQLRLLLAKAHIKLKNGNEAWAWLNRLPGKRALLLRLQLFAAGLQPKNVDLVTQLQIPALTDGEIIKAVVEAMFAFTKRGQVAPAAQLRRVLSTISKQVKVRRALRYQQAMDKALTGELNSALTLYLELAGDGAKDAVGIEADSLLPKNPYLAAAEILISQGAFKEAAELEKLQ